MQNTSELSNSLLNRTTLVYLVLILQIFFLGPVVSNVKSEISIGTLEEYWQDTNLGEDEILKWLKADSCYSDDLSFLSCINAISTTAEKLGWSLSTEGRLEKLNTNSKQSWKNFERRLIESFEGRREQFLNNGISFIELWETLKTKTNAADNQMSQLVGQAINAILSVAQDPHTYLLPLAYYEEVVSKSDAAQFHSGMILKRSTQLDSRLMIKKVIERSSAELAGLMKGDEILEIQGRPVESLSSTDINDFVRMRTRGDLVLKVKRHATVKEIQLDRIQTQFPSVIGRTVEIQNNRLGLMTIHKFSKGVCDQSRTELQKLKSEGIAGIMLDLRDNPGGQVEEAGCVISLFVSPGTKLFETRYKNAQREPDVYISKGRQVFGGPLVVLINAGSASASEIVAGALKDLGRATLVGERSFGKGSFQDGRIWVKNPKLIYFQTEGLYYFPSGWTPQLVGIEPDLKVDFMDQDATREVDLYHNPIRPLDLWSGPQNLSWLTEQSCDLERTQADWATQSIVESDPQVLKGQAWLYCGMKYGRNGNL